MDEGTRRTGLAHLDRLVVAGTLEEPPTYQGEPWWASLFGLVALAIGVLGLGAVLYGCFG